MTDIIVFVLAYAIGQITGAWFLIYTDFGNAVLDRMYRLAADRGDKE